MEILLAGMLECLLPTMNPYLSVRVSNVVTQTGSGFVTFPSELVKHVFEEVLNIKAVRFVDYPGNRRLDQEAAAGKKILAERLQANASQCQKERDNEAGWINNVANLVFGCLDGFEFQW